MVYKILLTIFFISSVFSYKIIDSYSKYREVIEEVSDHLILVKKYFFNKNNKVLLTKLHSKGDDLF